MTNWHPIIVLAIGVVMIPVSLRAMAALADWLETTRLGRWVRERDRG